MKATWKFIRVYIAASGLLFIFMYATWAIVVTGWMVGQLAQGTLVPSEFMTHANPLPSFITAGAMGVPVSIMWLREPKDEAQS